MLEAIRRAVSFLRQKQILHKLGCCGQRHGHRDRVLRALSHAAAASTSTDVIEAIKSTEPTPDRAGGAVRGRRLFHADLL